jgi:hypothetical protein
MDGCEEGEMTKNVPVICISFVAQGTKSTLSFPNTTGELNRPGQFDFLYMLANQRK